MNKQEEKYNKLFTHWFKIPAIKIITIPKEKIFSHEVRLLIVQVLKEGIKDEHKEPDTKKTRHVLNAREILTEVNKKLDEPLKIQSLYFHLQKLQDYGIVKIVETLHEGRHNIAYFGRTARGFYFEEKEKKEKKFAKMFQEISKFIQKQRSENTKLNYDQHLQKILELDKKREEKVMNWIKEHESEISDADIDIAQIVYFLLKAESTNREMYNFFKQIAEQVGYNL